MIEIAIGGFMAGFATVIDGDTIDIYGTRIRLWGIDAPEIHTAEGKRAKAFLENKILELESIVECHEMGPPNCFPSGCRMVAQCTALEVDLAELLVCAGHAVDWYEYSGGHYRRISCKVSAGMKNE